MPRPPLALLTAGLLAGCADRAEYPAVPPPTQRADQTQATDTESGIEITPAAEDALLRYAREATCKPGWMVRLRCEPGGCTGLK
ncbi:MAG TPA: hypothetical protein VH092_07890, partial [Urbifossiella sp.]|nr:hypothetical protein [Urbifossiella sp.]